MKPYEGLFAVGSRVCIADLVMLQRFLETWRLHNPLKPEQLTYAGRTAEVERVGFYHGGEPLYFLKNTPGVWHEQCLGAASTGPV
jgi:hypothetical protein